MPNRNYLKRKTKRNNFIEDKSFKNEKETTINLFLLNDSNYNIDDYSYIKFSSSEKIKLCNLREQKSQIIKLNLDSNKIYIIDKIELLNEEGNKRKTFLLPIYIRKSNICYISLKHKKNGYCFELIFYSKNKKKIRETVLTHKNLTLDKFDNYGLSHRKKINVINIEKNFAKEYVKNITLDSDSYKICSRIKENGEIASSIHELKLDEKLNLEKSKIKANANDIKKIYKFFNEFINNKSIECLEKYKSLNNENVFENFKREYIYVNKSYNDIPEITENDIIKVKECLLKLIIHNFFIDFSKMKTTKNQKNNINNMIIKVINNFTSIIDDIENFTKKLDSPIIHKFRLYRSTLYNVFSIIKKTSDKIICLQILSKYNQKIMNLKRASKNSPFKQATMFMKNIAKNLNEDSCILDLLLQYNSGISNDVDLLRRKRKKYKDNDTKYELSMLTVKEVAKHLEEIIPDFIVRYTNDDDIYAFYSSLNDIIFFNDRKAFKSDKINNYNGYDQYTLPIVILLIHECWGHRKVALSNTIKKNSPIRNYLINKDFEEDENIIYDKTGKVKGESGFELEYLITGIKYNNILSEYLLKTNATNNSNLLDVSLWIQPNFTEFQNILKQNCEENYGCNIDELLKKNRENKSFRNLNRYVDGTYNEDGIEIELFKV